ncbi:hypothetical protein NM688_g3169 [Phlebia brevispora]|uniref:Uncharacterized protein n=1 Tax=Phlebia brevispora TaxID=194682 RepID=A0ACC1T6A9_9APHY|nr:hypothetical protein NM688_g3169 [Phlebia brevispora]
MSDGVPESVIVAEYQANLANNYTTCLTTTLACYEYFSLLEEECRFIRRKWNSATWIFLANRYLMLVTVITLIAPLYVHQTCYNSALQGFLTAITTLPGIVAAIFSGLRIFALLRRNYVMGSLVFCLGMVPVVGGFYIIAHTIYYYVSDPVLGDSCYGTFDIPPMIPFYGKQVIGVAGRVSVIVADITVIVATFSQTYRHVRMSSAIGLRGIGTTLLRDGSIYFIALTILNIARLLVSTIPSWQSGDPVADVTDILQPILISRFIVNLRQVDEDCNGEASRFRSQSQFPTFPVFRIPAVTMDSVVGPMGEPLEYADMAAGDKEDGEGSGNNVEGAGIVQDMSSAVVQQS